VPGRLRRRAAPDHRRWTPVPTGRAGPRALDAGADQSRWTPVPDTCAYRDLADPDRDGL